MEVADDDYSKESTTFLICDERNREYTFVGEEGILVQEEPFGRRRRFTRSFMQATAKELAHRGWECGEYLADGGLVKSGDRSAGSPGQRYIFCQDGGRPVSLEFRVAPGNSDGSRGAERTLMVKVPD